jgi:hypothetical protein
LVVMRRCEWGDHVEGSEGVFAGRWRKKRWGEKMERTELQAKKGDDGAGAL